MLEWVEANDWELLVDALVERLEQDAAGAGLLPPRVPLVVPSRGHGARLARSVSERLGIAAGLERVGWEPFLARLLAGAGAEVLGRESLLPLVLAQLEGDHLELPVLAPVRDYLQPADPAAPDVDDERARRRWQLAQRLTRAWLELERGRPEVLAAWLADHAAPPELVPEQALAAASEPWQRALWRRVFAPGGELERAAQAAGRVWLRPGEVAAALERLEVVPAALHVFGLPPGRPADRAALAALARRARVRVYRFSPAAGAGRSLSFGRAGQAGEGGLLSRWEAPLLAEAAALAPLAERASDRWRDPCAEGPSALRRLQRAVLLRQPLAGPLDPDDSLQLLGCATPAREAEAVVEAVWSAIRDSGAGPRRLRFDEVAIVLPPAAAERTLPHLLAVCGEAGPLPVTLDGFPRPDGRGPLGAVERLLDLPLGSTSREEVLELLDEPAVAAGLAPADPADCRRWVEALGVWDGIDAEDRAGTYLEPHAGTWDTALRRLALGAFLAPELSRLERPLGGVPCRPAVLGNGEREAAGAFLARLRALLVRARELSRARLTLPEWGQRLADWVDEVLHPEGEAEEALLGRLQDDLRALATLHPPALRVPYRVARQLAAARLEDLVVTPNPSQEGVRITTPARARLLPWRAVFVLGLGETDFPTPEPTDALDLVRAAPQEDDLTAARRDRVTLLELLAACRERLVLSWVDRDALSGDPLAPSPVISELPLPPPLRQPLRRYDPALFPAPLGSASGRGPVLQAAWEEARVRALRQDLAAHGGAAPSAPAELDPALRPLLDPILGLLPAPPPPTPTAERRRLPLSALRGFLECPRQAWAKHCLGLQEQRGGSETPGEPWTLDRLREVVLVRQAFWDAVAGAGRSDLPRCYEEAVAEARAAGEFPPDPFGAGFAPTHRALLQGWWDMLSRALGGDEALGRLRPARLGGTGSGEGLALSLPPLVLAVDVGGVRGEVELLGETLPFAPDGTAICQVALGGQTDSHFLRGFFDHVVLVAAGVWPGSKACAIHVAPDSPRFLRQNYEEVPQPLRPDQARDWLTGLAEQLLGGPHDVFFPFEAVTEWLRQGGDLAACVDRRRGPWGSLRGDWGPLPKDRDLPLPEHAEQVGRQRLGPWVQGTVRHSPRKQQRRA